MDKNFKAKDTILGTFGTLWWDGEEIGEIESFSIKVKVERESMPIAGTLDYDSKVKALKGEGKIKLRKTRSFMKKFLEAFNRGEDPRSVLTGKLKDPDTDGGQAERIKVGNVAITELDIMDFELGKKCDIEIPFTCTPSQIKYEEDIK